MEKRRQKIGEIFFQEFIEQFKYFLSNWGLKLCRYREGAVVTLEIDNDKFINAKQQ